MPIKVYGKGDTVSDQEFWDGRTTYNGLTQFLKNKKNDIAIRDMFNDNNESFALLEAINAPQFISGGVVKHSFSNEFDIKLTDFFTTNINNRTRHYVRCSPGIGAFSNYAYINKPATELAAVELTEIFNINSEDDELVEIKYNYDNDTFKAKVHKIVSKHMEILEFTNNTNYEIDSEPGYNTGVELLAAMHDNEFLLQFFKDTVGDYLVKIDLEKTVEVTAVGTYYWAIDTNGLLQLIDTPTTEFLIGNFTIVDLDIGIDSFDNTHIYTGETEVVSGDLVVTGSLSVSETTNLTGKLIASSGVAVIGDTTITGSATITGDATITDGIAVTGGGATITDGIAVTGGGATITGDVTVTGDVTTTDGFKTGNYEIVHNSADDSLDFNYIG